ncbi:hypothetical protein N7517_011066 [Penicillium concentricum]|uniref:Uncharacterized protein n=1 Tax=Penicillium concentricum TaxID=293559 RepID=A0A9W9UT69_9EURO|nr:uncharacterized protein N7517_011066 [Penicillium concentricum]KAJ5356457.1 hypothetical protein N7517_011066 [Penicillium concentricum]
MTNELAKDSRAEEMKIIQSINALLNPEEQEAYMEHQTDDSISRERGPERMDRPQHNHTHDAPVQRSNENSTNC